MGCGCGTVGRAVAQDTRDQLFESRHRQLNISNIFICQLLSQKDKNKEKEAGNGPFKNTVQVKQVERKAWCLSKVSVTEAEAKNWCEDGKKISVYAWIRVFVLSIHHHRGPLLRLFVIFP